MWSVAAVAFRYYIQNFSHYDVMFGSIGAIMVLLVYVRLSITVLLFGAEVNAVIEQRRHAQPDRAVQAPPSRSSIS
ncbi:YhjD/YihY/BrkB family envelope integrity protein [Massilia forsythiae]|uniref:YhjD/YihY/BrkB family envelope integrity protein n=1 Tax=Massilia forsythiae TaxID=2728020 RepID=UPI001B7D1458|nr:YhjD/YihY/BrkB family envelope integrity protein [Massilia forsythiae]